MQTICSASIFQVTHLNGAVDFYMNQLGFDLDYNGGAPAYYARLRAGNVLLRGAT